MSERYSLAEVLLYGFLVTVGGTFIKHAAFDPNLDAVNQFNASDKMIMGNVNDATRATNVNLLEAKTFDMTAANGGRECRLVLADGAATLYFQNPVANAKCHHLHPAMHR